MTLSTNSSVTGDYQYQTLSPTATAGGTEGVAFPFGAISSTGALTNTASSANVNAFTPPTYLFSLAAFYSQLQTSLVLASGTGSPTFTRADATPCATHTDFEGRVRVVPANAARFQGCRVVRNLLLSTEDISTASWSAGGTVSRTATVFTDTAGSGSLYQVITVVGGNSYNATFYAQLGTTTGNTYAVYDVTHAAFTVSITNYDAKINGAGLTRLSIPFTAPLGTTQMRLYLQAGLGSIGTVTLTKAQVENVTGQTNQNPSEYVSVGVLSYPYQGAGVDGLLFSPYLNGNTVASNVVTAGTGAAIKQGVAGVSTSAPVDASGPMGYLAEGSRQNVFLNSDLIGTNLTTQSVTVTAAPWTVSFTGTGTITFTGAFTGSLVGSGATTRVQQTFTPSAGALTCTVTGTVQKAQAELGSFASSFIPTAASAVTRAADILTYPSAGNISGTVGSVYAEIVIPNANSAAGSHFISTRNLSTGGIPLYWKTGNFVGVYDGTTLSGSQSLSASNSLQKLGSAWSGVSASTALAGATVTGLSFDGDLNVQPVISIGIDNVGTTNTSMFGTIRNVRIWPTALTAAQLKAITA